jgi:hypothetical protein
MSGREDDSTNISREHADVESLATLVSRWSILPILTIDRESLLPDMALTATYRICARACQRVLGVRRDALRIG